GQKLMMMGTADEIVKVPEKGHVFMKDLSEEEHKTHKAEDRKGIRINQEGSIMGKMTAAKLLKFTSVMHAAHRKIWLGRLEAIISLKCTALMASGTIRAIEVAAHTCTQPSLASVTFRDVSSLGGCVPDVEAPTVAESLLRMDNVNVPVVSLSDHWMSQADVTGVVDNVPNDPCTCDISSSGGIQELRVITDNYYLGTHLKSYNKLYIALSRATTPEGLKILLSSRLNQSSATTKNIVFWDFLQKFRSVQVYISFT
nr:ubiquitin carboxyl-terminal hydrolase [Tanacetum cinerariifolium]